MIYCTEGHKIDDTNESYGGIICGICGGTFADDQHADMDVTCDEAEDGPDELSKPVAGLNPSSVLAGERNTHK